jgi:hypothetical protein
MNKGREISKGDADGDRNVGESQKDAIKNHLHGIKNLHGAVSSQNAAVNYAVSILDKNDGAFPRFSTDLTEPELYELNKQPMTNSIETRPRNIALYAYIKIN